MSGNSSAANRMKAAVSVLMLALASPPVLSEDIDLGWLAGAWCMAKGQYSSEEHWLPRRGGLMLAMSRTITKRGTEFEFVRIEFDSAEVRYIAQPSGGSATTFTLVDSAPNQATFANPQHDFPKRIRYTREGNSLLARIDDGKDEASAREFRWQRCTKTKGTE
jgi:hypothetical protein